MVGGTKKEFFERRRVSEPSKDQETRDHEEMREHLAAFFGFASPTSRKKKRLSKDRGTKIPESKLSRYLRSNAILDPADWFRSLFYGLQRLSSGERREATNLLRGAELGSFIRWRLRPPLFGTRTTWFRVCVGTLLITPFKAIVTHDLQPASCNHAIPFFEDQEPNQCMSTASSY